MRIQSVTVSSQTTAVIPLDTQLNPFAVGISAIVAGGSTLTYAVEWSLDGTNFFTVSGFAAGAVSVGGSLTIPAAYLRVNVSAFTSGSVTVTILQPRSN